MSKKEIRNLIKRNSYIFSKYGIRKLGLFGSFVRGDAKKNSDVDVIVDFDNPTFRKFIYLARELEKILRKKVDLLTFSSLDRHLKPYILKEVEYVEKR